VAIGVRAAVVIVAATVPAVTLLGGPTSPILGGIGVALVGWAFVRFLNWRSTMRLRLAVATPPVRRGPVEG
jgi:hypothetical protein